MKELLEARGYNRKVYDVGDGKKVFRFHARHVHYKEGETFKEIDTTLSPVPGGWAQGKASFSSFIPHHADEEISFRNLFDGADHFIKAKPVAAHVQGEVFNDTPEGNYVLYPDAFGPGIDLKVFAYAHGLKKVIVIKERPADTTQPMIFDFEMVLEEDIDITDASTKVNWNRLPKLVFKNKTVTLGREGKKSFFRDAILWDSAGKVVPVDIEMTKEDGKIILRKSVPAEFLAAEDTVYPIFTDHPTSYFSGAGDGVIIGTNGNFTPWNTVHDASSGAAVGYTGTAATVLSGTGSGGGGYRIQRVAIPIDTSGIPDGDTITAAALNVYVNDANNAYDPSGPDFITVVNTTTASDTQLEVADYSKIGDAIDNPTEGIDNSERKDVGSVPVGSYLTFNFNATGIGWVNKTGYTKLGLREGHDVLDVVAAWTNIIYSGITIATSEDTSGTKDPYLDVTTTGGGSFQPGWAAGANAVLGAGAAA